MATYPNLQGQIYQGDVTYGPHRLALMQKACNLMGVPKRNITKEEKHISNLLLVKLFDPCGIGTWYVQDWDGEDICFGYVTKIENEWGNFSLKELSNIKGRLHLGIEIDVHFTPIPPNYIDTKIQSPYLEYLKRLQGLQHIT